MTAAFGYRSLIGGLGVLTLLLFLLSLVSGPADVDVVISLKALVSDEGPMSVVMREIRLPRALLGLMIGATLGLSGAVLQGFLRNPLAEPGILGISQSAAFGAVLALYTGLSTVFALALPLAALAGALVAVLAVRAMAGREASMLTIVLAGVAVSALAGAMTTLVLNLSPNPFAALEIVFWMMGSLSDRSMTHVWLAAPFMLAGWIMLAALGRDLDTLTLGSEVAASLGVSLERVRLLAVLGTAASVGAATAVAGAIGFVGLIVPHLLRPLTGGIPSRLLPASGLAGASMLLAADILVRTIAPDQDLKLGVLTAIVGAPFFFWLVWQMRRRSV